MNARLSRSAVATLALGTVLALAGTSCLAQESPRVTVTPSVGLSDGQVVSASASGFLAQGTRVGEFVPSAYQCRAGVFPTSYSAPISSSVIAAVTEALRQNCAHRGSFPRSDGDTTREVTVTTTVTPPGGGGDIGCGATPGDCVIVAAGVTRTFEVGLASAPISFRAPTPQSRDDCRDDGWRRVVDDQGRPFRSQGQCIKFVVRGR